MMRLTLDCLSAAAVCTRIGTAGSLRLSIIRDVMEMPCPPDTPEPGANLREGRQTAMHAAAAFRHAMPLLIEILRFHWSTGQGTRVRHILWSLYTCSHLVNLGDACSGLDERLAEALAAAVAARLILGPELESCLRDILKTSGEFDRFNRQESATPDHLPVLYPPAVAEARQFREMADALDHATRDSDGNRE